LSEVAKRTNVPASEVEDVKRSLIVRSGGDARAAMCFYDTVTTLESGRALLDKYPHLIHASELENHARHSGKHAAGVIVANVPMKNYCTIDAQGIAQVDKYDCESINLMKIDVLGLKTLSVLADAMGDSPIDLTTIQLDDEAVFEIFNKGHLSGVFQFEGQAVQSLCAKIGVRSFEDIVSITSLGRPGPLFSGGAAKFIARKRGDQAIEYIHPIYDEITKNTYGLVLYQEQVMSILKQVGQMEWADVQILRRAMSKSLGLEFFEKFYDRFLAGATANGMTESATRNCWELLITFGSYGFTRSHAVAYALLSYYCAYFKAYHTVAYACASLNHQEMEAKIITTLRELVKEGTVEYVPFDRDHSIDRWNHVGNKLIGPLTKKASAIIERRKTGKLTASDLKLLSSTDIKAAELFAIEKEFGDYYTDPASYDVLGKVLRMNEVGDEHVGSVTFIGKMVQKTLHDLNENIFLSKRDGQLITRNSAFINFRFEDDTDKALATIGRYDMARLAGEIIDAPLGSIWLIKGQMKGRMKKVYLSKLKRLK
jgi:DNA polymerase III alpha subunit